MKWSFVIQQKLKAAILLSVIMLLVVLNSVVSKLNIQGIDESFDSIYADRLIPAIDIVYLMENLYNKRLVLEKHLLLTTESSTTDTKRLLYGYDQKIDSLITAFEQTYLVEQESKSFKALKTRIDEYAVLEKSILSLSTAGHKDKGWELFEGNGAAVFHNTITRLNELTNIQSIVGKELMKSSKSDVSISNFYSTLQIVLAIVIGGIILSLIQSSKIINTPPKNPTNLN
jgi:hypothetical protein